jgi:hypothetical protein
MYKIAVIVLKTPKYKFIRIFGTMAENYDRQRRSFYFHG